MSTPSTLDMKTNPTSRENQIKPLSEVNYPEQMPQLFLENSPLIFWSVDRRLKITMLGGLPLKEMGVNIPSTIGTSLNEHFKNPESQIPITYHLQALGGERVEFQYEFMGKFFNLQLSPFLDEAGSVSGVMGWAMDITQQKQTQDALQERLVALTRSMDDIAPPSFEDLFNIEEIQTIQDAFAEATGVASVITDIEGRPITRPSNFCRLCNDIIRKTPQGLANCMHSDAEIGKNNPNGALLQPCLSGGLLDGGASICVGNHHIANWLIGQVLEDGPVDEKMLAYAREIGADINSYTEALKEVTRMPKARFEKVVQALYTIAKQLSFTALQNVQQSRFIAERRKVEEDLGKQKTLLRTIIDNLPDSIYVKDLEGRKTIANPADLAFVGAFSEGEVLGKTDADVYPQRLATGFMGDDERVIKHGIMIMNKVENIIKPDGSMVWILTSKVPLRDQDGKLIGLVGTGRNITEQKKSDEEIRRLNSELEQRVQDRTAEMQNALKELEAFSYSVSHDLRAPLRAINGYSQILLEDQLDLLTDEGKIHLYQIINSTKRMSQIVDDLLNLSKVTRLEMKREWLDLGEISLSILNELKQRYPQRKVEINIETKMLLYADISLVRIMMENLLENAWKYSSKKEVAHIQVGKTVLEGKAVYFVWDDGVGFDMAYASKLFTAFQRLHSPAEFEGTGIGLATVQRIIARHGGRVWARSFPDQGATFYFMLP